MTTKHLAILLAALLGGMGLVFLLPRQLGYQPVGIKLGLPEDLHGWRSVPVEVTQKEHEVLGFDTEFARRSYISPRGDRVLASIVLSGQDMMTGLHRPERCLLAQGWNPGSSSGETVDVPGFGSLDVTRLRNSRKIQLEPDAPSVTLDDVCYYWFVGSTRMVSTHERRVFIDAMDRIFHGYNQRWAMVMVSGEITSNLQRGGRTEEQTDEALRDVVKQVTPVIVKEGVTRG
jgi:EpsI family protein